MSGGIYFWGGSGSNNGGGISMNQLNAALVGYLQKTGGTLAGSLNMNNNRITNLPTPSISSEPATKGYVDADDNAKVNKAGDTMSGNLDMTGNYIRGVHDPLLNGDVVNLNYYNNHEALKVKKSGDSMTGNLVMNGYFINPNWYHRGVKLPPSTQKVL